MPRGPSRRNCSSPRGHPAVLRAGAPGEPSPIKFRKITLTRDFYSEGACVGDFNHDGHNDIAAGPYWYEGPDFNPEKRHEIYAAQDV